MVLQLLWSREGRSYGLDGGEGGIIGGMWNSAQHRINYEDGSTARGGVRLACSTTRNSQMEFFSFVLFSLDRQLSNCAYIFD
jgi:hypothetical protein